MVSWLIVLGYYCIYVRRERAIGFVIERDLVMNMSLLCYLLLVKERETI